MNTYPTMTSWPRNPQFAPPFNPLDTTLRYRAQSVLLGLVDDPLPETADEARDVLRWTGQPV